MIELLQWTLAVGKEYPDSGPGSKVLQYGDENLGYFGKIAAEDFFTQTELATATGMFAGALEVEYPEWIKCFINGKVLFIPSQPIRTGLCWNDLYSAGVVYGTDDNGKYPGSPAVNQFKLVTKRGYAFKVRTFGQGDPDPTSIVDGGKPADPSIYEWGKFLHRFYDGTHPAFAGTWKLFPIGLIASKAIPQMFSASATTSSAHFMIPNGTSQMQTYIIAKTWSGGRWQPVLELVDTKNTVFAVKDISDKTFSNELVPVGFSSIATESTGETILRPIPPTSVRYTKVGLLTPMLNPLTLEIDSGWLTPIKPSSVRKVGLIPISVHTIKYEP